MSKIYVLEENRTGSQEFTQEGLEWCGECFSPIEKKHNEKFWSKPLIKQKNTWESLFFIITNILKIQKKEKDRDQSTVRQCHHQREWGAYKMLLDNQTEQLEHIILKMTVTLKESSVDVCDHGSMNFWGQIPSTHIKVIVAIYTWTPALGSGDRGISCQTNWKPEISVLSKRQNQRE